MAQQDKLLILEDASIRRKITRMAYEIIEDHLDSKQLLIAGIDGQGYALAKLISKELKKICAIEIEILKVSIDKRTPEKSEVVLDKEIKSLKNKPVLLVDDVLNTGKIITYAMKPFLDLGAGKLGVAVLVNRSHLLFPVRPDYTGLELTTTLTDHIEVVIGAKSAVYLH